MRKLFSGIMLLLSLFCISVSIYILAGMKLEDHKSDKAFEEIREVFDQEYPENSKDNSEDEPNINPGLLELHEKNPDCVGWIQIEDTHIDYPVMYHPEEKNYYLRKNFNQKYDISGTPFIAEICDPENFDNLIIYGHHMNSGAMFADLDKYKNESFYQEHKKIIYSTLHGDEIYEVMACFAVPVYTGNDFAYYAFTKAETLLEYKNFVDICIKKSYYNTGVISVSNSLRQCIQLISEFPLLAVYAYHAYNHYEKNQSMYIHNPDPKLSTAENLLMMLRHDQKYTPVEAKVLDTSLILHMEHGGGNNSTFTTRVVTSSGSDTYSTIAAAMSSLKGPKHGGANKKVVEMMDNIRENVKDFSDKEEISAYLMKIIDKQVFDKKGLIYGMGHAVYTLSDPRERVFKKYVEALAREKGRESDLQLYENVEVIAPKLIAENRNTIKRVSPNVDFYSGFVYDMLGIPRELYTAIFAVARVVGWSAHRMEELICTDKIIRPAYMSVMEEKEKC